MPSKVEIANQFLRTSLKVAAGVLAGSAVLFKSLYTVEAGHRAVFLDRFRGVLGETTGEGTHFQLPFIQKPSFFDVRTRQDTISSVSGTKDLQMVKLTLRILSHPEVDHLIEIYRTLGLEYHETVFPSIGNEVLKGVVAQFNADQLLTERGEVSKLVRTCLIQRAKDFNIEVDDVAIIDLSYGAEFSKAVEEKQVAQQETEMSKFVVAKAEQERRAAIIKAEGESESAKLISDATYVAGQGLIELRKIEATKHNATALFKNGNVTYLPIRNKNIMFGFNPTLLHDH